MNNRQASGLGSKGVKLLHMVSATATVALSVMAVGCQPRADDINRVQPGYVSKALFNSDDQWYYRRTIVKSETTNRWAIEGQGDLWMDRVKFRIEENWLIAYRPYEAIPGSQDQEEPGKGEFEGSVLAAWPITRHFDIVRNYDPVTGNQSNLINENTVDRVWSERDYMRVNFANNSIESSLRAGSSIFDFPLNVISTGSLFRHCDANPTDEFCSRFTSDVIDVVDNVYLGMDLLNCAALVGYSYSGYQNCGFGEAKVRHNFVRVKEESDYVPRAYPDSIVRKGADGKPLYDSDTGEVVRESLYNRFGIFRLEIPTYDRGYATTESGRLFRAMIFNLWEKHTDGQGNVLPYSLRTPKPVIYHLNVEYPERWFRASQETAAEYNRVLTSMVTDLSGRAPDFPMFEIRRNDCNVNNIKNYVSTNPDRLFAVERIVCKEGEACSDPLSMVALGNLKKVCTSLENATRDRETGMADFDWQRIGDSQNKMLVWLSNPQRSGWGGYGPMHADGRTGETISATSYIRGFVYEVQSANVVDWIEYINDEKTAEEVIYGQDIRKHLQTTLARATGMREQTASRQFLNKIDSRMAKLGANAEELLPKLEPNFQTNRMKRVEGTKLEADYLVDSLRIQAATNGKWKPGDAVTDELKHASSPLGWMQDHNPFSTVEDRRRRALTAAGFCFLERDFDPHWAGLALQLKDLDRKQRYEIVGNMLVKHVLLHELGHNFGLAHNFEGSYDALNYFDEFWDNHWADAATKTQNRYEEKRNTTVMEYMSAKGGFTDRLGKYDEAAIRFAYGNQVQVFDDATVTGGESLRNWRYYNDFNKIPDYLCGAGGCASPDASRQALRTRSWVNFDPQNPPTNEVPYLFCDNYYDRRTPFCSTFDYGATQREIFTNYYNMWSDYYFFNNFVRDRLTPVSWSTGRAMFPVYYAMIHWATVGQYLYFLRAFDGPQFFDSDLASDMLATVGHGLNMAAEVMSTPLPLRMCPWPGTTSPQIYIPNYYLNDCDPNAPINSDYALQAEQIHLPLGDARPASLGFTEDFVDFDISFVGSYFDKYNMMWLLGLVRQNLFMRFDFEGQARYTHQRYNYSVFRIFEEEIRDFYDRLIRLDGYRITQEQATDLGSYWCRDPENPTAPHMGYFEPRRMIDPTSGELSTSASASCMEPALVYPNTLRNIPFDAMFFAHALFSDEFDTALDMGKSLKVYVVGSDDEFPEWRNLPADEICSCVDALTQLDYRSVRQPTGIPDLGCRLVERACQAQQDYYNDESSDWQRERWRAWFERLEFARDLSRVFDR